MKAPHIMVALLVLSGLGMSFALLPREQELALIRLRDADLAGAAAIYDARFEGGDHSATTVTALSRVAIEEGRVEHAVELVKLYVGEHPDDAEAWSLLATYASQAQDTKDYIRAQVRLVALLPTRARLRELMHIYEELGDVKHQAAALSTLIERFGGEPEDFIKLARIEAADGAEEAAVATLQTLEERAPQAVSAPIVGFRLRLLADLGRIEEAIAEATAHASPQTALFFAETIDRRFGSARAAAFLDPYAARPDAADDLVAAVDSFEASAGRQAEVIARLDSARAHGALSPARADLFVRLAVAVERLDDAATVAIADATELTSGTIVALVDALWSARRLPEIVRLADAVGSDTLADQPLLGAEFAAARGDAEGAAHWLRLAREEVGGGSESILRIAELEQHLGLEREALRDLEDLMARGLLPHDMALDTAALYVHLGRAAEGAKAFDALRRRDDADEIVGAWAITASAAGQPDEVAAWLAGLPAASPSTPVLEAIHDKADEAGRHKLALLAIRRLVAREPTMEHRLALAQELFDDRQFAAALDAFRELRDTPNGEARYGEALIAATAAGAPVLAEMRNYWRARLERRDVVPADRDAAIEALLRAHQYDDVMPALAALAEKDPQAWLATYVETARSANRQPEMLDFLVRVGARADQPAAVKELFAYAIIDAGGARAALPVLRQLAQSRGGQWADAFENALGDLGRNDELRASLLARAERPATPAQTRREIAYRLLETGSKTEAERLFLGLAAGEGPDGPDLRQLLYLWGPRPRAGDLAWLAERCRAASGGEQGAWMRILTERGAAKLAVVVYEAARPSAAPEAHAAYVDALSALGDKPKTVAALRAELAAMPAPDRLQRIGDAARDLGDLSLAREAFEALVKAAPGDGRAQRSLGFIAFDQHDFAAAEAHLERYLATAPSDWEGSLTLGEIKLRAKDEGWRRAFAQALQRLDQIAEPDFREETARAHLLYRTGRIADADRLYATLLQGHPDDKDLRANYATMLIDLGEVGRARAVLVKS
jgi:tetratricopeptide (TPR) repeat protein